MNYQAKLVKVMARQAIVWTSDVLLDLYMRHRVSLFYINFGTCRVNYKAITRSNGEENQWDTYVHHCIYVYMSQWSGGFAAYGMPFWNIAISDKRLDTNGIIAMQCYFVVINGSVLNAKESKQIGRHYTDNI